MKACCLGMLFSLSMAGGSYRHCIEDTQTVHLLLLGTHDHSLDPLDHHVKDNLIVSLTSSLHNTAGDAGTHLFHYWFTVNLNHFSIHTQYLIFDNCHLGCTW